MKVQEVVAALEGCQTHQELELVMQRAVENYGFASFNFLDAGRAYAGVPFYSGTTGRRWETAYKDNNFAEIDPYVFKARRSNLPFDWRSISSPTLKRGPKSKTRQLMDAAFDFGFREGLVVPYHFRDDLGRSHSVLCAFYWQDKEQSFRKVVDAQKINLHIFIVYFIQRAMQLLAKEARDKKPIFATISNLENEILTDREREVLQWAAVGKTASETADILAVGETTINYYLKNALIKLDASNRTHAVAKALTMGLIDL